MSNGEILDDEVERNGEDILVTGHYPPANISPSEFEEYIVELLSATNPLVQNLTVKLHEIVSGADGDYDFDATVRYELAEMAFLVLIECKRHKSSIKRETVQILFQKLQSVGAHKAVIFSTSPYQSGALKFAKIHGIALVTVTEGRFTYETKSIISPPPLSREWAYERFGLPTFVGHLYGNGNTPESTSVWTLGQERPEQIAEQILGFLVP